MFLAERLTIHVKNLTSLGLKYESVGRGVARRRPGSTDFDIFPSVLKLNE